MGCASVNTVQVQGPQPGHVDLELRPCVRDAGHTGDCRDAQGRRWVRLREVLRQRGLVLDGPRVRHVRDTNVEESSA